MLHAIVMAGGSGTRFWPSSRAALPKQLLPLAGSSTLLQDTVGRFEGLIPSERTLVVPNARLTETVHQQLPNLPPEAVVGEPCKRDTAPCIGLAALLVLQHDPEATMAVMPSDHVIEPAAGFRAALTQAAALVEAVPGRLVTFGIRPTSPSPSYGYIQQGEPLPTGDGEAPAHRVAQFREKPPVEVAREYVAAGNFLWNAGIFVWRASTIIDALATHQPECLAHLKTIAAAWATPDRDRHGAGCFVAAGVAGGQGYLVAAELQQGSRADILDHHVGTIVGRGDRGAGGAGGAGGGGGAEGDGADGTSTDGTSR